MFRAFAVAASLSLMGCSSGTEPQAHADLANAVQVARFADDAFFIEGYPAHRFPDLSPDLSSCTYDDTIQGFDCAVVRREDTSCAVEGYCALTKHVQLFVVDDAGRSSTALSSSATRVRVVADVTAKQHVGSGTVSSYDMVRRHSDVTVEGVQSAVLTMNGSFAQVDSFVPIGLDGSRDVLRTTGSAMNMMAARSDSFPKAGVLAWSVAYDPPHDPGVYSTRLTFKTPPLVSYEHTTLYTNPPQTWGCTYDLARRDCVDAYVQK